MKLHGGVGTLGDALTKTVFRITNEVRVWVWVAKNPAKNDPNLNGLTKPVKTH